MTVPVPDDGVRRVTTIGDAMVLLLAEPGVPLRAAATFRRSLAGAEVNVAVGMARLGHHARWIGRVGEDAFGDVVVRTLRAEGVDVGAVARDPRPTGVLVRDAVPGRPVEVVYHRLQAAGAAFSPDDLPADLADTDLLHLTAITGLVSDAGRAAVVRAARIARAAGVPVSVDPNLRWTIRDRATVLAVARELVALADVVLASADELEVLTGRGSGDAAGALLDGGASVVVEKTGAGARAQTATESVEVTGTAVPVVDPVGAGDAFDAAFLDGHLRGRPLEESLAAGARAGALVVGVPTDLEGLPYARDLATADTDVRR